MYTSRTYYGDVIRDSDGVVVAPTSDLSNPDYVAYLAWLGPFNRPKIDDTMPPVVPQSVTPRQMETVLDARGLLAGIESFVASQPRMVQIAWNKSTEFHRDNLLIAQFAAAVGLTHAAVDDLFIAAGAIA